MIRYATEPGSPVVEITLEGRLTDSDLRGAIERLQADVEENGKTRVLERIEHFSGMEPAALWTDIKLGMPLAQKITRAAVVADAAWIRRLTDIGRLLTRAEVKTFRPDELDDARTWINAD
ncbi:STAS/SEC14 domain-containing protein [Phenylobacterium sp. LjRoot225]|uniref:STAS/SEC14 domain-containing protein n=1 Tax=Phenylobacterium sp. LjRoot225 TaxID=3342285 RepID=UPI003ED06884